MAPTPRRSKPTASRLAPARVLHFKILRRALLRKTESFSQGRGASPAQTYFNVSQIFIHKFGKKVNNLLIFIYIFRQITLVLFKSIQP